MYEGESQWEQVYFKQKKGFNAHTIAWNRGKAVKVWIDEVPYTFDTHSVLPIMLNQSFRFEDAKDIVAWQFDRNFYCLQNHDAEVGCYGFLFFGPLPTLFIPLNKDNQKKIEYLYEQFNDEFGLSEEVKAGMLRALLVNLVILLTRFAKKQNLPTNASENQYQLMRQFNFMVELHYKKHHQVQHYASLLNRSPKTIGNIFSALGTKTPLQIIHERIITEAKRLLLYTPKSIKEIASELGFADLTHFSKFFRNHTGYAPSDFARPKS